VTLETDEQKTLYALGIFQGKSLRTLSLNAAELDVVTAGLSDAAQGKPAQVDLAVYGPKAQNIIMARQNTAQLAAATAQRVKDAPFLEQAAKEEGAMVLPSGVVMKVLAAGKGDNPQVGDRVRLRYEGHLTDGTPFDSSEKEGDSQLALSAVLPCWNEALRRMGAGASARLVCPPSTAFGDQGRAPKVPPGAALVFSLDLLEINPVQPVAPPRKHRKQAPSTP
jgi:FKBP-type peptidyl-prolyl cis-trans isomerase FkpA